MPELQLQTTRSILETFFIPIIRIIKLIKLQRSEKRNQLKGKMKLTTHWHVEYQLPVLGGNPGKVNREAGTASFPSFPLKFL